MLLDDTESVVVLGEPDQDSVRPEAADLDMLAISLTDEMADAFRVG